MERIAALRDVDLRKRCRWVKCWGVIHPSLLPSVGAALKRLKRQGKAPRYDQYFSLTPLLKWLKGLGVFPFSHLPVADLLDATVIALRLGNLMRSGDLARISWGLWTLEGMYFIKVLTKGGCPRVVSVQGLALDLLLAYVWRHRNIPGVRMFRQLPHPAFPLGAERLAKRTLLVMGTLGVDTTIFKAHSLRGAAATFFMKAGVPKELVQARGGWSSQETLMQYYSRAHQSFNWDACLGLSFASTASGDSATPGDLAGTSTDFVLGQGCSSEGLSPDPDVRKGGGINRTRATLPQDLSALGVLQPMGNYPSCARCRGLIRSEAGYLCQGCDRPFHVRCLKGIPLVTRGLRGLQPTPFCRWCWYRSQRGYSRPRGASPPPAELIEDVMGVCTPQHVSHPPGTGPS